MLKYKFNINDTQTDDKALKVLAYKTENISSPLTGGGKVYANNKFQKKMFYCLLSYPGDISNGSVFNVIHNLEVHLNEREHPEFMDDGGTSNSEYIRDSVNGDSGLNRIVETDTRLSTIRVINSTRDNEVIGKVFKGYDYNMHSDGILIVSEIDRFFRLPANSFMAHDKDTAILLLNGFHFFKQYEKFDTTGNLEDRFVYVRYTGEAKIDTEDTEEDYFNRTVYAKVGFEFVTNTSVKCFFKESSVRYYSEDGDRLIVKPDDQISKLIGTININNFTFYRETPFYTYTLTNSGFITKKVDKFVIFQTNVMKSISVPISENSSFNLLQSEYQKDFVDVTRASAINRIVEMEKDKYEPVVQIGGKIISSIQQIVFNLHFRERNGDDWIVDADSYWNGVFRHIDQKGKETLYLYDANKMPEKIMAESKIDFKKYGNYRTLKSNFFTTYNKQYRGINKSKNFSEHSDLLTYLNFTNDEIKYQKSKIKKSFLRISFFDSMMPENQNLLGYYTVFMPIGELFGKYAKNNAINGIDESNEARYSKTEIENDTDGSSSVNSVSGLTGARVDREFEYVVYLANTTSQPLKDVFGNDVHLQENRLYTTDGVTFFKCVKDLKSSKLKLDRIRSTEMDDINSDDFRLSSRITIDNGYVSQSSSEGFNLYLWKENDNGVIPSEIYMKIEFNHAGYGRIIPFMMPFFDKTLGEERKDGNKNSYIKTFEDIIDDWNDKYAYTNEDDIFISSKYGMRRFYKYSYIRFKYRYDSDSCRHVYYMDDEVYGNSVNFKDGKMVINLYEAKII